MLWSWQWRLAFRTPVREVRVGALAGSFLGKTHTQKRRVCPFTRVTVKRVSNVILSTEDRPSIRRQSALAELLTCQPPCHPYGRCVKNRETGENECTCNRICTREYAPVCGTDGKTYSTECMMKLLVCEEGTNVNVKHPGECRGNRQGNRFITRVSVSFIIELIFFYFQC